MEKLKRFGIKVAIWLGDPWFMFGMWFGMAWRYFDGQEVSNRGLYIAFAVTVYCAIIQMVLRYKEKNASTNGKT